MASSLSIARRRAITAGAVSLALALITGVLFRADSVQRFEGRLATDVHIQPPDFPHWQEWIVDWAATVHIGLYALAVVCWIVVLVRRGRLRTATLVVVTAVSGVAAITAVQHVLQEPRPPAFDPLGLDGIWETPSGHGFGAALIATLVVLVAARTAHRRRAIAIVVAIAAAIGVLRILNGMHYLGDVVVGWCAGVAWGLLVGVAVDAALPVVTRRWPVLADAAPPGGG